MRRTIGSVYSNERAVVNAIEVTAIVTESASRFGDRDPQQFKQLTARLREESSQEVARGLLDVFTAGAAPPAGSSAQELAGRLLAEIVPEADFDLASVVHASLARYELSVEQFPQYLRSVFGAGPVLSVLQQLESQPLAERERRSLNTLRFWLGGDRDVPNGGAN